MQRYEEKQEKASGNLTALRMLACLILLGGVLFMRACFPGAADAVRATVLPMMEEDIDYRAAISAIGERIAGEGTILEVLGELYVRAFGDVQPEGLEVQAQPEAVTPAPIPTPTPVPTPGPAVIHPPIEEIIYLPEPAPPEPAEPDIPYEPAALAVFLARQEAFAAYTVPVSVCLSHAPLPFDFVTPLYGPVSSPFGFRRHPILGEVRFHFGTDVAVYTGTPFVAFADGRVVEAGENAGFGLYIRIDHGGGIYTRYAHASALYVRAGDLVSRGEKIGRVGKTGDATGPHLHFELKVDGAFRNPEFYLTF